MEKPISVVIIDDEQKAIDTIRTYLEKIDEFVVEATFTDPKEGLVYVNHHVPQLLILDVMMDKLNGLELVNLLKNATPFILCTSYENFALQGFELEAIDYLLKPTPFDRFLKAMRKAEKQIIGSSRPDPEVKADYIFININKSKRKIDLCDINYVEAHGNYVKISLASENLVMQEKKLIKGTETIEVHESFKNMKNKLPESRFLRANRSFLVPFDRIHDVGKKYVYLTLPPLKQISLTVESHEKLKQYYGDDHLT